MRVSARRDVSPAPGSSVSNRGDLMLGQTKILRDELARFFAETPNQIVSCDAQAAEVMEGEQS